MANIDCDQLQESAELLHGEAAARMARARRLGTYHPEAVEQFRKVAEVEEVAAKVEAKIAEDC